MSVSSPQLLVERFGVEETTVETREPDYNVTPRAMVPIVRDRPPRKGVEGPTKRALTMVRWGLVPSWAESTAIGDKLINARAETITEKAAYKRAFARRRCIVPADAFYEWRPSKHASTKRPPRQPYLVHRRDGEPMAFAGLWEIWRDPAITDDDDPDAWVRSCVIVTTSANDVLEPIHSRMPVMLDEHDWDTLARSHHRRPRCARGDVASRARRLARGVSGEHARQLTREQRRRAHPASRTRHAPVIAS